MAKTHSLPGDLTIYAVDLLRTLLQGWVATLPKGRRGVALNDVPLPVDASGVNEVDAAGVQMLLALSKSLRLRRRPLRLIDPSGRLVGACGALGVASVLLAGAGQEERV
jgi:anti-anti-sigma regulatory factor